MSLRSDWNACPACWAWRNRRRTNGYLRHTAYAGGGVRVLLRPLHQREHFTIGSEVTLL